MKKQFIPDSAVPVQMFVPNAPAARVSPQQEAPLTNHTQNKINVVPDKRRLDIYQHSRSFGRKNEPGQQHGQSVPSLGAASGSRLQVDVQLGGVAVTLENAMMQMVHFTTLRNGRNVRATYCQSKFWTIDAGSCMCWLTSSNIMQHCFCLRRPCLAEVPPRTFYQVPFVF